MDEDLTAPSLNLSPEEFRLFGHLFRQADVEGIGVVTGEVAVKFFEKTRLEPRILGEIWQIADKENRGLLTPEGFGIVLRLIGHYQAGRDPTPELALQPGPLPKFVNSSSNLGLSPSKKTVPVSPSSTLHPQATGSGLIRVPPLTAEKAAQYAALFEKSGAKNGVLPGEQAKQIFERASLPNEVLGKIWSLADSEQKGALQVTEFVIAMHLLASCKTGSLRSLPSGLPYGLYEDAAQGIFGRPISSATGLSNAPRQSVVTRSGQTPTKLDIKSYETSPRIPTQNTGSSNDWIISLSDQAKFNAIYNTLDKSNRGFITGEEAVSFFSESKLPEEALAQIWDLADVNSAGRLSRDEFAIAMYLIRQQRGRRDGRSSLPSSLPSNLVPPSMRNQVRPAAVPSAPDFEAPITTLPKSAAEDLFGLDALSLPIIASDQPSQLTGGSKSLAPTHPSDTPNTTLPSSSLNSPSKQPAVQRFVPTSSFGQSLTQQITGGRSNLAQTTSSHPAASSPTSEDLLGDNDPEISNQLTSETAEVANLTNQIGSLSKQVQDLQCCKTTHQEELSQTTTQKLELENRLSQLRTQYEQELRDVRDLESRLASSQSERHNLLNEVEILQNKLHDLHNEHTKLLTSIRAEQQEEISLKERIKTVLAEISQLKPILEKEKLGSRHQKGLMAINKKQLALEEAERDRIKSEIGEFLKKREGTEPTSPSSRIQSAAPSTMNANNPFFRRKESSCETSPSNFANTSGSAQNVEKNLQNVFGAAFGSAVVPTEVPSPITRKSTTRTSSFCSVPPALNQVHSTELSGPRKLPTTFNCDLTRKSQNSSELPSSGVNHESFEDFNLVNETPKSLTNNNNKSLPCEASSSIDIASIIPTQATGNRESNFNSQSVLNSVQETETAKSDFDTAFAGLQSINKPQERTSRRSSSKSGSVRGINTSAFLKEFPPISKLENEDGESDSESEGVGFDDDFAPPSPGHLKKANILPQKLDNRESENCPTTNLKLSYISPNRSSGSNSSHLETRTLQATSDKSISVSNQIDSNQLSSCTVATSSPTPLEPITASSITEVTQSPLAVKTTSKPPTPPKIPLENDIDEFEDLEDAKEGDANDDFVRIATADQPIIDDFNPLFDNSMQSDRIQTSSQGLKESPSAPLMSTQSKTTSSVVNSKDDWDAIFAGFDPSQNKAALQDQTEVLGSPDSVISIPLRTEEEKVLHNSGLDDPILKNLTGMGYSRAEALKALEKYDYDLERAADYLANQS